MGKIKLIAIDIGGTLICDNNEISVTNIETLKKVKEKGIKIALITARMYSSTKYISNIINADYGVYGNGSNIIALEKKQILYSELIDKEILKKLIDFGKKEKLYIHLNETFYETSDEKKYFALKHVILNKKYPDSLKSNVRIVSNLKKYIEMNKNVVKVVYVSEKNLDGIVEKIKLNFPYLYISEYNTNLYETAIGKVINYIEIGTCNTSKASGLQILMNKLHLTKDEILVVGDGDNDIEMFLQFENSGCLKNGSKKAKESAKYVSTKTNNESGLSEIIEHYTERMMIK